MNNCNCGGLLPLIFGYFTGQNSQHNCGCCNCDQNVMPINNNFFGSNNGSWLIILLLLCCCCGGNNNCNCNN